MKKIFLFFFFLFFPLNVKALTLEELRILNGELSLPFDSLNNDYTVTLAEDVFFLDLEYKKSEDILVTILDNHDLENESVVTVCLEKEEEQSFYRLHILKEETNNLAAAYFGDETIKEESFLFRYKLYIIPAICLFALFFVHKKLFPKRKRRHKI